MAENFRDFLDPTIDPLALEVLSGERSAADRLLAKYGGAILHAIGGERLPSGSDGQRWRFDDRYGNPAVMTIHEPDIVIPMLRHGDRGLFYTYTGGDNGPLWAIDTGATHIPDSVVSGNPAQDGLTVLAEALFEATRGPRRLRWLGASALAPWRDARARALWTPDTGRTKEEIASHYDHRNAVYTGRHGFLDQDHAQYSSGWLPPGETFRSLEQLQDHKIGSLAELLKLDNARNLLEIGSGWGGLAVELARRYPDLEITSLTVSDEQLARARQRAAEAGVADRVTFLGEDYRDFAADRRHEPRFAGFDSIVSVEMVEAVDWRDAKAYFDALSALANPNTGNIAIQAITVSPQQFAHQRHSRSFLNTAIFPGGTLYPKEYIGREMQRLGWPLRQAVELGPSYALTLREWQRNLQANRTALSRQWQQAGVSPAQIGRFYRGYEFYLAFAQAAFRTGHLNDYQLAFG